MRHIPDHYRSWRDWLRSGPPWIVHPHRAEMLLGGVAVALALSYLLGLAIGWQY